MPEAVSIFILPPSRAELERRLRTRASDNEATIQRRLADARQDLQHEAEFDYVVVNESFDVALAELCEIVNARREGCELPRMRHEALLAELLKT
jgi:guanylate kinase